MWPVCPLSTGRRVRQRGRVGDGFKGFQGISRDFKGFQGISRDFMGFEGFKGFSRGLRGLRGFNGFSIINRQARTTARKGWGWF